MVLFTIGGDDHGVGGCTIQNTEKTRVRAGWGRSSRSVFMLA